MPQADHGSHRFCWRHQEAGVERQANFLRAFQRIENIRLERQGQVAISRAETRAGKLRVFVPFCPDFLFKYIAQRLNALGRQVPAKAAPLPGNTVRISGFPIYFQTDACCKQDNPAAPFEIFGKIL